MFTVYVLKSLRFEKFYVGKTNDVERRLREHNFGKSYYSSRYSPWEVLYSETFENESDALKRERYFKSHAGRAWLKKHLNA